MHSPPPESKRGRCGGRERWTCCVGRQGFARAERAEDVRFAAQGGEQAAEDRAGTGREVRRRWGVRQERDVCVFNKTGTQRRCGGADKRKASSRNDVGALEKAQVKSSRPP